MVAVVTAAIIKHNASWVRQPQWSSDTDSHGYWMARISTKTLTKSDFHSLLEDMHNLKIGVEHGSRADVEALP